MFDANVDLAVASVKAIVDNNRCVFCDKFEGSRFRYSCGHFACGDCVAETSCCVLCLTPPSGPAQNLPVLDEPLTQRAKNASALLQTFQDAFNIDVYKRNRISEQLKVEKELFPECIQAPLKYSNKRKSLNVSLKNKENRRHSFFPGEQISPIKGFKMEKSNYVLQWLDQNKIKSSVIPRKPLSDLVVNQVTLKNKVKTPLKRRIDKILDHAKENSEIVKKETNRKHSHFKTTLSMFESQSRLNTFLKPVEKTDSFSWNTKKIKKDFDLDNKTEFGNKMVKTDKEESGIFVDDDVVVIDDIQSKSIDKDKRAWLAVLEANENESCDYIPAVRLECSEIVKYTNNIEKSLTKSSDFRSPEVHYPVCHTVPFYKKGLLLGTCQLCNDVEKTEFSANKTADKSKNLSIMIESKSFITTIKLSHLDQNTLRNKHSVSVQTEINAIVDLDKDLAEQQSNNFVFAKKDALLLPQNISTKKPECQSQDLFTDEPKNFLIKSNQVFKEEIQQPEKVNDVPNKPKHLVVADSDSDVDFNDSSIIQVTADVHRSSDQQEHDVLTELDQNEVRLRARYVERGRTPLSTDSSDKENYDPNRAKRIKFGKKNVQKKWKRQKYDVFDLNSILSLAE